MTVFAWMLVAFISYTIYRCLFRSRKRITRIQNKCVFVTGCDSGFGRALVDKLDSMGVHVFAGCYTEEGMADLKRSRSNKVIPVRIDVSDTDSVRAAYEFVRNNLPAGTELWGLVNNAGLSTSNTSFEFTHKKHWLSTFAVNTFGMMDVTLHFLPLIRASKGRVVNMSSGAGRMALPHMPIYSTSKFATGGFTACLRRDMAKWGVKVCVVEPGFYKTQLSDIENVCAGQEREFHAAPEHIKRSYGEEYLRQGQENTRMLFEGASSKLHEVTDCYVDALFSVDPQTCYLPGPLKRRLLVTLISMMPDSLSDPIVAKLVGQNTPRALS